MGETSWAFLLVGSFAAVGAALALGTLAAIVRYHRTGAFPGAQGEARSASEVTRGMYAALWARVVIGVVLAVAGLITLQRQGLL